MNKSILKIIAVLAIMQTSNVHAYNETVFENCIKQKVIGVKAEGCKVVMEVQLQFRNPQIETAYDYFCAHQTELATGQQTSEIIVNRSDDAISSLIEIKNSLSIGDENRSILSNWISKMMGVRLDAHVAELNCSLKALPVPFDK